MTIKKVLHDSSAVGLKRVISLKNSCFRCKVVFPAAGGGVETEVAGSGGVGSDVGCAVSGVVEVLG